MSGGNLNFRGIKVNPYSSKFDTSQINQYINQSGENQNANTAKLMEGVGKMAKDYRNEAKLNRARDQLLGSTTNEEINVLNEEISRLSKTIGDEENKLGTLSGSPTDNSSLTTGE
jgi:hypothetical protein